MLAACGYGVVHDEITVRLCIEYFTVAHPPLFYTGSPTLLALCWGIAATVGLGAALGVILALVSQSAGAKPYPLSRLGRSILFLLAIMGASAFVAGCIGYVLSRYGLVSPPAELSVVIAESERDRFMAAWFAHGVSYVFGLGGGALLCFCIWRSRGRPAVISFLPHTRTGTIRAAFLAIVAAFVVWFRFYAP